MNNQQYYHILTIGVPILVASLVTIMLVTGFIQPSFEGADGVRAKMLDDNFCRVSAFNTNEEATAEQRSAWCSEAQELGNLMVVGAFFVSLTVAFLILRSMVKPISEWDNNETENRSALN